MYCTDKKVQLCTAELTFIRKQKKQSKWTVQQYNSSTVQQYNSTTVQQYNSKTVQQ